MQSQLGLIILGGSEASSDEMSGAPDPDGGYGPMDGLLDEIALGVELNPANGGFRRPEGWSSSD